MFAMRQGVNLVHEDYYEQGADHSTQMDIDARSAAFRESIQSRVAGDGLMVSVHKELAVKIDSGSLLMFRPSNSSLDYRMSFMRVDTILAVPGTELVTGRYILKLNWFSGGTEYAYEETVYIE